MANQTNTPLWKLYAETPTSGMKAKHWAEGLLHSGVTDDPDEAHRLGCMLAAEWRHRTRLQAERYRRARREDPLIVAAESRYRRTPSALAAKERQAQKRADEARRSREAREAAARHRRETRESLKQAAREARKMGGVIEKSTDRQGRVSSYYWMPQGYDGPRYRISDHDIPETPERRDRAAQNGRYFWDGSADLMIDQPRRKTWLRRALTLLRAGRDVPA